MEDLVQKYRAIAGPNSDYVTSHVSREEAIQLLTDDNGVSAGAIYTHIHELLPFRIKFVDLPQANNLTGNDIQEFLEPSIGPPMFEEIVMEEPTYPLKYRFNPHARWEQAFGYIYVDSIKLITFLKVAYG